MRSLFELAVEKQAGVRTRLSQLWNPVYRRAFAHFGAGTTLVAPQMIQGVASISLGEGTFIRAGAWLAVEPGGALTIGDGCYMGHHVHLHAGDPITVGDGCTFADNVFLASVEHDAANHAQINRTGAITIEDDVFLGQNVVVLGGVTIGRGAVVGAGAVVTKDVPAGETVVGVPAKPVRRP